MNVIEWTAINDRLMDIFPGYRDDTGWQDVLYREVEDFCPAAVGAAVTEFVSRPNADGKLYTDQLRAIACRIDKQIREREAAAAKLAEKVAERAREAQISQALVTITDFIKAMTDEEVQAEWRHVVNAMNPGKPREWCEKYTAEKIRGNVRFQLHIAGLRRGHQRVA